MGYGYGVWLVYNQNVFTQRTPHVGHITIACFMDKNDATTLYNEIIETIDTNFKLTTDGLPILFPINMYKHDKNNLCSWGFNFKCLSLPKLQTICNKYKCDFSYQPHTSIEYSHNSSDFKPYCIEESTFKCKVHIVDIRSDFPNDWEIIQ